MAKSSSVREPDLLPRGRPGWPDDRLLRRESGSSRGGKGAAQLNVRLREGLPNMICMMKVNGEVEALHGNEED